MNAKIQGYILFLIFFLFFNHFLHQTKFLVLFGNCKDMEKQNGLRPLVAIR